MCETRQTYLTFFNLIPFDQELKAWNVQGLGEGLKSNEKWVATIKTQAHPLMQAMDEDVHVEQLMDDLFLLVDIKDPKMEVTKMNAGLGVHGVNNANMVQQIYFISWMTWRPITYYANL
jgi:hypothetical protein